MSWIIETNGVLGKSSPSMIKEPWIFDLMDGQISTKR